MMGKGGKRVRNSRPSLTTELAQDKYELHETPVKTIPQIAFYGRLPCSQKIVCPKQPAAYRAKRIQFGHCPQYIQTQDSPLFSTHQC